MSTTIRAVLDFGGEHVRLIVPDPPEAEPSLDVAVSWIHSSELLDPTPFLESGQVVLTDGSQFTVGEDDPGAYDEYARRLGERGIVGVGFGTQLVHGHVPLALEAACRRHRLVLFEITDLLPFLALIRFVADRAAAARAARARWSAEAQRALSRAALRPDGLTSILTELERQLACRAMLFDATGVRLWSGNRRDPREAADERIRLAVAAALDRGIRSSSHVDVDGEGYTLQTLGDGSRLYGALVLSEPESHHPDAADVVNGVIALASLALTQNRTLDLAQRHLRSGVLEQLVSGNVRLARRTAEAVWGKLPDAPAFVVIARTPDGSDFLFDSLEREAAEQRGAVFFATRGEHLIVLVEESCLESAIGLFEMHGVPVGISRGGEHGDLTRRAEEAAQALEHAIASGVSRSRYEDVLARGMLGVLRSESAAGVARGVLAPLREQDARRGTDLLRTARVWIGNECAWEPSATALGIHRHTLRNRIRTIERALGLDLSTLRDRLELWAALQHET